MKVFVTGATGFIGKNTVKRLIELGHECVCLVRSTSKKEALEKIKDRPKPLAFYYFSKNRKNQERILKEISFGGGCINDTLLQFGSTSIPVGGVGSSGIGSYHGKSSFLAFSNTKGIVKKTTGIDIPFRYAPYEGKMKILKWIFKL